MASVKVSSSLVALVVTLAWMLLATSPVLVRSEISCLQVTELLAPCIPYGMLGGPIVPPGCCEGVKGSLGLIKTTEDLRQKCQCVKDVAAGIPLINYDYVNQLYDKCNSTSLYKVSPDTDCSKLKLNN